MQFFMLVRGTLHVQGLRITWQPNLNASAYGKAKEYGVLSWTELNKKSVGLSSRRVIVDRNGQDLGKSVFDKCYLGQK